MFDGNEQVRELVGELGVHLDILGRALNLQFTQRGTSFWVTSRGGDPESGINALKALYNLVESGFALHPKDVAHAVRIMQHDPGVPLTAYFTDTIHFGVGRKPIVPRTPGQRAYVHAMRTHDIVFGVGPAGTGKTFLGVAMAAAALASGSVKRIILTRPAVEAGEKLGFLPGDLFEKVDPYLRPLYDSLAIAMPPEKLERLLEKQVIEVAPLAFMRGRTLNNAIVLLDEAQNTTAAQMRMFLTRLGDGSKMFVNGDITQIDLPRGRLSGMVHALDVLGDVAKVAVVEFGPEDVIRHPLVADIIRAYETDDREREGQNGRTDRSR